MPPRATSCPSRCRSRTRPCGWRAAAARPSTSPPPKGIGAPQLQLHRAGGGQGVGRRLLRRSSRGVRARRLRGEPQRGGGAADDVPRRRADRASTGASTGPLLRVQPRPLLRVRHAPARPHRHLGRVPAEPRGLRLRPTCGARPGRPGRPALRAGPRPLRAPSARPTRCATSCGPTRTPASTRSSSCQQAGNNRHEDICESLELFATEVMPEFHEDEAERRRPSSSGWRRPWRPPSPASA